MAAEPLIPNRLKDKRLQAGIQTPDEAAARADIDPTSYAHYEAGRMLPTAEEFERLRKALGDVPAAGLYQLSYLSAITGQRYNDSSDNPASFFQELADHCHVLLARDEIAWFERQPVPDHHVDVFMNLSCGTQDVPHLLLDTVAVLETLEVDFVAAAGTAACCGKPFINVGRADAAERVAQQRIRRSLGWGARTHVNWCTACQVTTTTAAARRLRVDGVEHPVREVQVLTFLEERLRELGDRVPWTKSVPRRVLVEGHPRFSTVHRDARAASARLLAMIPGVEVVSLYDGNSDESPCGYKGQSPGWTPPGWSLRQDTPEGIREHRETLAEVVRAQGADTVACQHQTCHLDWCRYASDRLGVCHAVSILAEALGCGHPDRRQAAIRLGNPGEFLVQTRSIWQSWGISEARARELASFVSDPKYADAATQCSCGGGECRERLITVDVLTAASQPV